MVCERVDFKYSWGIVDDGKVNLDLDYIADKYNRYYKKMFKQCHDGGYARPLGAYRLAQAQEEGAALVLR